MWKISYLCILFQNKMNPEEAILSELNDQQQLAVKQVDGPVMVIAGEDKGKTGKVLKVYPEKNRAIVEGRNLVKKHTKPSAKNTQGGIVEQEAPIHLSNLMVMDGKTPTRIGRRISEKTGKLVRYSKKSGEEIK